MRQSQATTKHGKSVMRVTNQEQANETQLKFGGASSPELQIRRAKFGASVTRDADSDARSRRGVVTGGVLYYLLPILTYCILDLRRRKQMPKSYKHAKSDSKVL